MSGILDEEDSQETIHRRAGEGYEWRGKKLECYNFLRKTAARSLGLRWGMVEDSDIVIVPNPNAGKPNEPDTIKMYKSVGRDAVILLWVCSHDRDKVKAARRNPKMFEDAIDDWADENKIDPENCPDEVAVFIQIVLDAQNSEGSPKARDSAGQSGSASGNASAPQRTHGSSVKSQSAQAGRTKTRKKSSMATSP